MPSSTTSKPGCGWRAVVTAIGIFAFGVAGLMLISIASNSAHRFSVSRWPRVQATTRNCRIDKGHRKNMPNNFVYYARCGATFMLNGKKVDGGFESRPAYYEHRTQWWANPGIDELRAWVAAHPDGTQVTVRSDPDWPPTLELDPNPEIFDDQGNLLSARIAGAATIVGIALIALAIGVPR